MDKEQPLSAQDVVNRYHEKELERIFREFGEERLSRKIAEAIVRERRIKPIDTCHALSEIVERVYGRRGRIHPATKTFQALGIEVNKELDELQKGLDASVKVLKRGGLLCVISYHSLEDRIVKHFIARSSRLGFGGNPHYSDNPENGYLNRVIDRRTGNPINLCLLFMLVARRLRLPVTGIGLPGHFICRYQTSSAEIYIDPFSRGKLKKKVDCINYLLQANYSVREDYLAPVKPRRMLLRICKNLHQIYRLQHQDAEATRFQRYETVLSR